MDLGKFKQSSKMIFLINSFEYFLYFSKKKLHVKYEILLLIYRIMYIERHSIKI